MPAFIVLTKGTSNVLVHHNEMVLNQVTLSSNFAAIEHRETDFNVYAFRLEAL
jgi:hypothetical protein